MEKCALSWGWDMRPGSLFTTESARGNSASDQGL